MGKFIVKLHNEKLNKDYYLEWSTIVDAPTTYGMPLDLFKKYYLGEHRSETLEKLEERLKRVEEKGTSSLIHDSLDDLLIGNRAGDDESTISKDEIIKLYCNVM